MTPLAQRHRGLELLVLFGSRARGDATARSDWDFAYLGGRVDQATLHADLMAAIDTDAVDLVDLASATGLLRYRVARDGRKILDSGHAWDAFRWEAVSFWCDAEPVLERAYDAVLQDLRR